MDYPINIGGGFLYIFVVVYLWLYSKPLKEVLFGTKMCDSIKIFIRHRKNHPRQNIEDGYIWWKHYGACTLSVIELIEIEENKTKNYE